MPLVGSGRYAQAARRRTDRDAGVESVGDPPPAPNLALVEAARECGVPVTLRNFTTGEKRRVSADEAEAWLAEDPAWLPVFESDAGCVR